MIFVEFVSIKQTVSDFVEVYPYIV